VILLLEFRCKKCGKLLAKIEGGKAEILCPRCKTINEYHENAKSVNKPEKAS